MKKIIFLFSILALLFACAFTSCSSTKLESGGVYAPTNSVPDQAFFEVDSAFDLAFSAIDGAFKFERDNRDMLWNISPSIKHAIDQARPVAVQVGKDYVAARAQYIANPTPAGLSVLQLALQKAQALSSAVAAAIKTQGLTVPAPSTPPTPGAYLRSLQTGDLVMR